jgi:dienelactone hydrolase
MKNKTALIYVILTLIIGSLTLVSFSTKRSDNDVIRKNQEVIAFSKMPDVMPGTKLLSMEGDLSVQMMDGAHRFIEKKIDESQLNRSKYWNRNFSSREAYESSIEPNRKRFMKYIGVVDKNLPFNNYNTALEDKYPAVSMEKFSVNNDPALVSETSKYRIYQVRWPVFNGVSGEGLLLQPKIRPIANIVALPDADQTPEQLAGLTPGISSGSQYARRLAENGFQVLIPLLINRSFIFPGTTQQQTYRERIYRQAYHMGRHIIGYEVQKVISAIDWFRQSDEKDLKIGVAGYAEGGLIAFYSAAIDKRIDVVLVSGYFNSRQKVWDEPIYRNVWALLSEFGDAEIATLVAPRSLIVEYSVSPEIFEDVEKFRNNPTQVGGTPFTGYKGRLSTSDFTVVKNEFDRIDKLLKPGLQERYLINDKGNKPTLFGSEQAIGRFASLLNYKSTVNLSDDIPTDNRKSLNPEERQIRQVKEIEDNVQWLMRISDMERNSFFLNKVMPEYVSRSWSTKSYHPYYSPAKFIEQGKEYRKYFQEEILGKFDDTMLHPNPQTRKIYDKERWTGYEVVLDVYPDLFAWGILLIPKDIKPGERRPVVVCQHGRAAIPQAMVEGNSTAYNDAAAKLADQGFIVYAPHNLYRGEDRYRWLSKKANTVKKTLFSFIISQHDQTIRWLGSLSFVDKSRIAFYGLSYGGETAMRVPSVLESYCLSICSGDFGDWTRRVVDVYGRTFMNSMEWEMPYFNMGSTFSYAEMAYLIFPRPFMVERGHDDLVESDERVSYEYGKVRYLYDHYNLGDKTTIEFYNGGHSMRSEGSFTFLHKHLNWP